ncbi:hypothetical protein QJS04_geneDACA006820 [Acorus gramineus]|uniref:AD domain-containing protein n=1 Tax=Acorus gramineus TaxID=55184 RepID=A0AAV9AWR2_ACOGR|nr:hypothetical protein QJS04_geneDACA006820 [Acorus gramineus]
MEATGTRTINGEDLAVGCFISMMTTLGEEIDGQILAFDKPSNILVIQEGRTNANKSQPSIRRNVRLLKAGYIRDFTLLGRSDEDPLDVKQCFVDLNGLRAREDSAMRQAEMEAERIGVGVTSEAQSIFDALSKTLPVRWDKTAIILMNEVRVSSPYLPENVSGGTAAANERVKKVLEFERKRLNTRQ